MNLEGGIYCRCGQDLETELDINLIKENLKKILDKHSHICKTKFPIIGPIIKSKTEDYPLTCNNIGVICPDCGLDEAVM